MSKKHFFYLFIFMIIVNCSGTQKSVKKVESDFNKSVIVNDTNIGKDTTFLREEERSLNKKLTLPISNRMLEILMPLDRSVYKEQYGTLSVKIKNNAIDEIKIFVDDFLTDTVKIDKKENLYCKSLYFNDGINTIRVKAFCKNVLFSEVGVSVYVVSRLYKKYKYSPSGYVKKYFHNFVNESKCSKCHKMYPNDTVGVAFRKPQMSNCYTCHKDIVSRKYVHNEKNPWACSSCHGYRENSQNLGIEKSKFLFPDPIAKKCFSCHKKEKKIWKSKKVQHEPFSLGKCNKCHNPHSSDTRGIIRADSINELCVSCHVKKKISGHIVNAFSRKKHPTSGFKDPTDPTRELRCTSCHNPHASNSSFLTQNDYKGYKSLCIMCHKK